VSPGPATSARLATSPAARVEDDQLELLGHPSLDGRLDRVAQGVGRDGRKLDVPMPYAANLEKLALPSVAEVVEAAKAVSYR